MHFENVLFNLAKHPDLFTVWVKPMTLITGGVRIHPQCLAIVRPDRAAHMDYHFDAGYVRDLKELMDAYVYTFGLEHHNAAKRITEIKTIELHRAMRENRFQLSESGKAIVARLKANPIQAAMTRADELALRYAKANKDYILGRKAWSQCDRIWRDVMEDLARLKDGVEVIEEAQELILFFWRRKDQIEQELLEEGKLGRLANARAIEIHDNQLTWETTEGDDDDDDWHEYDDDDEEEYDDDDDDDEEQLGKDGRWYTVGELQDRARELGERKAQLLDIIENVDQERYPSAREMLLRLLDEHDSEIEIMCGKFGESVAIELRFVFDNCYHTETERIRIDKRGLDDIPF